MILFEFTQLTRVETASPMSDPREPSPRIQHLYRLLDSVQYPGYPPQGFPPLNAYATPSQAVHPGLSTNGHNPYPPSAGIAKSQTHLSPQQSTPSQRGSNEGPSPSGSNGRPRTAGGLNPDQGEDIIELPNPNQTYNGEPVPTNMTPMFADTPAWLTEGTTAPINIYHRKSSDGLTLRLIVEALSGQQGVRFDDTQDPLDTSPRPEQDKKPVISQLSPFGTLNVPTTTSTSSDNQAETNTRSLPLRRSTIRPHWTQQPRILVVEDDVVYRQLSSKFLEKFGCITETVENAQGAIDKMNRTKYDLVLMDIFFGPSMDGYVGLVLLLV